MSKSFKRNNRLATETLMRARSRTRSRSRSRSVTPGPGPSARRQLLGNLIQQQPPRDIDLKDDPPIWKPPVGEMRSGLAAEVNVTPRGSLRLGQAHQIFQTPGGRVTRNQKNPPKSLQDNFHHRVIDRAVELDLDEEEGEEIIETDHLKKWVAGSSQQLVTEPRPSTSGTASSKVRIENCGSEFDSDFDDELDLEEFAPAIYRRGDDRELEEPDENALIDALSRAMDDEVDRVIDISTDFSWHNDFASFKGVPEVFSGPTPGPCQDYDSPYEAFTSIFTRDFIETIVRETNRYASQTIDAKTAAGNLKPSSRLHRWTPTNVDEMYVFIAVFVLMGIDLRSSLHEYWTTTGFLEMPKFRKLMSYNRYILLNKFLHFTDNSAPQNLPQGEESLLSAKLTKLAPVLTHLNKKFQNLYNLQQDIAIDESLTLFKGRLSWIQSIRSKAARFGIKSFELCESKTGYLYKFEIYTGKNPVHGDFIAPSADLAGKTTKVVLDMLNGLEHRGHLVTMDNFYNCPALTRYLKCWGFDSLGTLRPNRRHVPVDIAKAPKNVPKGTIVARHSGDVSCIAWKDSKMVNMISSYHTDETYVGRKAGKELVKPLAVRDYNNTMGGVDLKDQKLSMYLMERKRCVKWYVKIFKRLLNTSVLNALIMLSESLRRRGMPLVAHRQFRYQLADSLAEKHGVYSSPQEIQAVDGEELRLRRDIVHVPSIIRGNNARSLCRICLRNDIRRLVNCKCVTCDEYLCFESCWLIWHSAQQLPGRDVKSRKSRRRN